MKNPEYRYQLSNAIKEVNAFFLNTRRPDRHNKTVGVIPAYDSNHILIPNTFRVQQDDATPSLYTGSDPLSFLQGYLLGLKDQHRNKK